MKKLFCVCLFLLSVFPAIGETVEKMGINDVVAGIFEGSELRYFRNEALNGMLVNPVEVKFADDMERAAAVEKLAKENGLEAYRKGDTCYLLTQDQLRQLPFREIQMRFSGKKGMAVEKFQEELRAAFKDERSKVEYHPETGLLFLKYGVKSCVKVEEIMGRYLKIREFKPEAELFPATVPDRRLIKKNIRFHGESLNKVFSMLAEKCGLKYTPRELFEGGDYKVNGLIKTGSDAYRLMDDLAFQFGLTLFVRDQECHILTQEELAEMKHLKRVWKLTVMNDGDIRKVIGKLNSEVLTTVDGKAKYKGGGYIELCGQKEQLEKAMQVLLEADRFKE